MYTINCGLTLAQYMKTICENKTRNSNNINDNNNNNLLSIGESVDGFRQCIYQFTQSEGGDECSYHGLMLPRINLSLLETAIVMGNERTPGKLSLQLIPGRVNVDASSGIIDPLVIEYIGILVAEGEMHGVESGLECNAVCGGSGMSGGIHLLPGSGSVSSEVSNIPGEHKKRVREEEAKSQESNAGVNVQVLIFEMGLRINLTPVYKPEDRENLHLDWDHSTLSLSTTLLESSGRDLDGILAVSEQ